MDSSSGTTSGSTLLQSSGSDEDLLQLMEQRKRRRLISNRESARRSRMKKQKRLSELMTQLSQLRKENNQLIASLRFTSRHFVNVEAENSVLRAQVGELSHRLESLNEIVSFLSVGELGGEFINESLSYLYVNQPVMASAADMLMY
ncbi:hypothetical protein LguiA_008982 [Lonicera macranthoides]